MFEKDVVLQALRVIETKANDLLNGALTNNANGLTPTLLGGYVRTYFEIIDEIETIGNELNKGGN